MHIKKNDTVIVLSGDDKGRTGKVTKVFPHIGKVLIDGINMVKKHERPRKQGQHGQIVDIAMPLHASKVMRADLVKNK